jgi:hypothetical protein
MKKEFNKITLKIYKAIWTNKNPNKELKKKRKLANLKKPLYFDVL